MSYYQPPVRDMLFILHDVLGFKDDEFDLQTCEAVLEEAAKLSSEILAPLNRTGDQIGASLENGCVKVADGFKAAYAAYCDGGWNSVPFDAEYGGQGAPWALAFPIQEMWQGANMSFGLCPLLNQGAIEAIIAHGSQEQKDEYLPHLISGTWTGTMNLTEPQAGSDLGLISARAEANGDGAYAITGQKIYITYGDHDMADNIIHLVLARLPDAPDDVRGISLFIVPKIMKDGTYNTVKPIGLEHKLGIHGSPTCTMEFDGATGYLVGEPHYGLQYMFTMMNNARLSVGLQGVAIAEAAYQHAQSYADERVQGKSFETKERIVIGQHADVRRMLYDMRARIMAGRLMAYYAAMLLDRAASGCSDAQKEVDFLTPIVKAWCTDMAVDVTSTAIQVYGGMGFIEESGAPQFYRDARILPIYEGANGIQAADLVFRKIIHDGGVTAYAVIDKMRTVLDVTLCDYLKEVTDSILSRAVDNDLDSAAWMSQPYLNAFGLCLGGYFMKKMLSACDDSPSDRARLSLYYDTNILPMVHGYLSAALAEQP